MLVLTLDRLADSFAQAGYLVVMPDLFRGDPVPTTAMGGSVPGFNMTEWRARHPQSQIEEVIESAIGTIRSEFNVSKVGAVVRSYSRICHSCQLTSPRAIVSEANMSLVS